ncbi:MAG: aspartate/glutamate racemase family protein [Chloroflexi bacterium]|nr:aspartate/glutamate racemase family protein [Chloroflexota bacterium]
MTKVVMIHTVEGNTKVFADLCQDVAPGLVPEHVVDESLLGDTIAAGTLTDDVRTRFEQRAQAARDAGADVIMLTCSSIGPSADGLSDALGIPVLRVDEAMAERAITLGNRVGVAATLPTTLDPTADLVRRAAERASKPVEIVSGLAEGAFQALKNGDGARHDDLVRAALRDLAARTDVIVLAQASMARAMNGADSIDGPDGRRIPILTSPRLGVERLRDVVSTVSPRA